MPSAALPHVVFLFSDQHNPMVVGREGDPHVRTPHLDRLMDEGTSFIQTYCPSPLCVPSRMATLSGLLPSRTGVYTNYHSLRSDQATFVHSLALAGYETALCGRMHFVGPDQRHGYNQRLVGDITPVRWGMPGPSYGVLRGTPGQGRMVLEKSGPGDSLVLHYDQDVTDGACRFLEEYKQDKPLFLTVGWYGPHCPYVCPRDLFAYYYERLPLPTIPDDDAALRHPALRRHQQARDCLDLPEEWIRRARAAYWGLTEILDRHIGRVLEAIDRALGLDNTLVIYASDHGDTIGEHGLFWKSNYYEGSVRVPLTFRAPALLGEESRGRRVGQLASLLDLGPTLIDLAGGTALPRSDGVSLWPLLAGRGSQDTQRRVVSQLGGTPRDLASAMIRYGQWKLVEYHGFEHPLLFDLGRDPQERCDLGADPRYQGLRAMLRQWLRETWDAEAVQRTMDCDGRSAAIIRQYHAGQPLDSPDQWRGREQDNYIEPWP
jgi:choline-sulfatase